MRLQQYHQRGGQSWFWAKVLRWPPGLGILVMVTPNNSFMLVTVVDFRMLWWMFWRRLARWWVVDGALSWRQLLLQLVQPTNSKLSQPLPTRSMWRRYWCHSQTDSPTRAPINMLEHGCKRSFTHSLTGWQSCSLQMAIMMMVMLLVAISELALIPCKKCPCSECLLLDQSLFCATCFSRWWW